MDYKVELISENKLLVEQIFKNSSHPSQPIRKALSVLPNTIDNSFITVYVANLSGETWVYGIADDKGKKKMYPIAHDYLSKGDVIKVFSGAKKLYCMV